MKIYSPNFDDFHPMPPEFTADGINQSPELIIEDVPKGSKELTLIMHDPDASNGGDWLHWIAVHIPTGIGSIAKNSSPGVALVNDFGNKNYGGPAPLAGSGRHRYVFELYALDTVLAGDEIGSRAEVERAMQGHTLAQATWVGTYER